MTDRTFWYTDTFHGPDEPFAKALWDYDPYSRVRIYEPDTKHANLIASRTDDGRHMPILDLDIPHRLVPSTREGHSHLYIDVPIPRWRWWILLWGLYVAKVIDKGFFWWSLRRGANFARVNSTKTEGELAFRSTYGWFFKKKRYRGK